MLSADSRVATIPNIKYTDGVKLHLFIVILFVCNPYFLNNILVNDLVRVHTPVDTVHVSFYIIFSYYSFNMLSKKRSW